MRSPSKSHPDDPGVDDLARTGEERCAYVSHETSDPSWRCDLRAEHACRHAVLQHLYWASTWPVDEGVRLDVDTPLLFCRNHLQMVASDAACLNDYGRAYSRDNCNRVTVVTP